MPLSVGRIIGEIGLNDKFTAAITAASGQAEGFASKVSKMEGGLKKTSGTLAQAGGALTAGVTLPLVGLATGALKAGTEFEAAMNRVDAATADSAETEADHMKRMQGLRKAAQDYGAATIFSSTEAANALVELGKAGFSSAESVGALPAVLQLAAAGQMSMAEAATLTSNTMNTFGLGVNDLGKLNDTLAKAAASSTIDVRDLGESFKYAGNLSKVTGTDVKTLSSALALLGSSGISASMAGTAMRGIFSSLLDPGSEKAAKLLDQIGINAYVSGGKITDFAGLLGHMNEVYSSNEMAGRKSADMLQIFGDRAGPAMISLLEKGAPALTAMSAKLDDTGFAARNADKLMQGLPGALERMKGSVETAFVALNEQLGPAFVAVAGHIESFANFLTQTALPAFGALPMPVKEAAIGFAALLAAAGPVLVAVGGLGLGVSSLTAAWGVLAPFLPAAGTLFAALTGPIGLTVLAIAGLTAAWYKWGDDITRVVSAAYTAAKEWLVDKWEGSIFQSIARMVESMGKLWGAINDKVNAAVMAAYNSVKSWMVDKMQPIIAGITPIIDGITAVWTVVKDNVIKVVTALYNGVKTWLLDKFNDIVAGVKGKIDAVTGFFNNMYEKVVGHSIVPDMIREIGGEFERLQTLMVNPTASAADKVAGIFTELSRNIKGPIGDILGSAGSLTDLLSKDKLSISQFGGLIANAFSLGEKLQPLLGLRTGKLGALLGTNRTGRSMVENFAQSQGGFDPLRAKLDTLPGGVGAEYWKTLTQGVGNARPDQAQAIIQKITDAFAAQEKAVAAATTATSAATQAQNAYVEGLQKQMDGLNGQYAEMAKSIANEQPEEIMGVIEAQTRGRMEQIEAEKIQLQAKMDAAAEAAAATNETIVAQSDEVDKHIRETFAKPMERPYYFRAMNSPDGTGFDPGASVPTAVPRPTPEGVTPTPAKQTINFNISGKRVGQIVTPFVAGELEVNGV